MPNKNKTFPGVMSNDAPMSRKTKHGKATLNAATSSVVMKALRLMG
jgi:hypothetical protein